ncbi:MAG: FimV/HubP family polar landmark protein [Burkholderiales bacterium]
MGKRLIRTLLGGLLVCISLATHAAGLGRLTVLSGLGQPLRAEIEVVSLERGEAESLAAKLAATEAFRQANIEISPALQNLRFAVERRANNRYVIVMSSTVPVNDPFLDVLVELTWATGRLVREYTFLLDPQEFKGQPAQAQVVPPQTTAQAPPPPARAAEPPRALAEPPRSVAAPAPAPAQPEREAPAPAASVPAPAPAVPAPPRQASAAVPAGAYEVVPGDTLSKIAMQNLAGGVTLNQMLTALYRANQDAFVARNMNRLRAGRILNIPDSAAVAGIAPQEANNVVIAHVQEWDAYRGQLAAAVAGAPARPDATGQTGGGQITASVTEASRTGAPQDRLQLAQADPAAKADSAASRAAKQDDIAARDRALRESQSRVSQLEKSLKDLENLLDLKTQELARLQSQAKPSAPVAKPAPPIESVTPPAPAPVEVAKAEAPKPDAASAPSTPPPPVVEAQKKPATPPTSQPAVAVGEKGIVDEAMDFVTDNMLLIGGGAVGLIAVVGGFVAVRRRRANAIQDNIAQDPASDTSSVFGSSGGRSVDTGNPSQQTDFSQGGIGAIDTEEVDPVAEADVYMAYGRDAQAEEILKEALQKDQNRHAVRVKLLEIYSARKDLKAFETTAGELYAATGGDGPDWEKAAALGSQMDPSNTMYQVNSPSVMTVAAPAPEQPSYALPSDIDLEATEASNLPPGLDIALDSPSQFGQAAPEFNLDEAIGAGKSSDLEFDLNLGETTHGLRTPGRHDTDATQVKQPEFDIDLELTGTSESKSGSQLPSNVVEFDLGIPTTGKSSMDLGGINLDLGSTGQTSTGVQLDPHWQEVATKLDLAKAYHEMGDREGAKELLGEVMKEGDGVQQQQARRMLETIG